MKTNQSKKGFVHLFFMGVVLLLFMVFSTLTSEALGQKLMRKELEYKLKLDYATEAYYLLLREGELTADEGITYGDLQMEELRIEKAQNYYIQVDNKMDSISITGWFQGKRRGEYEIKK